MRAPEYEALLPVEERGVSVSFEGDTDFDVNLLKKISVSGGVVDVLSTHKNYKFSISSIELDDIKEMEKTLKRLNFDSTFEMTFS